MVAHDSDSAASPSHVLDSSQLDVVVDRLCGAGLLLRNLLRHDATGEVGRGRIREVLDELDLALDEIRASELNCRRSESRHVTRSDDSTHHSDTRVKSDLIPSHRTLRRVTDGEPVAYTFDDARYFKTSAGTLWAREREGVLIAARSGTALATRVGNVFYDIDTAAPLYQQDGNSAPTGPRSLDRARLRPRRSAKTAAREVQVGRDTEVE